MTPHNKPLPDTARRPRAVSIVGPFGTATAVASSVAIATIGIALAGCSDPPPPPPAPEPPPAPAVLWTLDDIDMDERLEFPDRYLPATTNAANQELAQSIADLASGLLNADESLLRQRLATSDTKVLDILMNSGQLEDAASDLRAARVVRFEREDDAINVGIALENNNGAFLTAWTTNENANRFAFSAMPIEPRTAERVAQLDDAELTPPMLGDPINIAELMEMAEQLEDRRGPGSSGSSGPAGNPNFGGGRR